jgi:hypothetical protein
MTDLCALTPSGLPRCTKPAAYEMDIDCDQRWIPLCVAHGPTYRRLSNVRVRTRTHPRAEETS